ALLFRRPADGTICRWWFAPGVRRPPVEGPSRRVSRASPGGPDDDSNGRRPHPGATPAPAPARALGGALRPEPRRRGGLQPAVGELGRGVAAHRGSLGGPGTRPAGAPRPLATPPRRGTHPDGGGGARPRRRSGGRPPPAARRGLRARSLAG